MFHSFVLLTFSQNIFKPHITIYTYIYFLIYKIEERKIFFILRKVKKKFKTLKQKFCKIQNFLLQQL